MNEIKIPIRRRDELVSARAISELPGHLAEPEDREVCRELLASAQLAAAGQAITVGQVAEVVASLDRAERRKWLDALRRRAGLETASAIEAEEQRERAEHANRSKMAHQGPLRLVLTPTGYRDLDEQEAEEARQQAEARSRAARLQSDRAQRDEEAEQRRRYQEALTAARDSELPEHLRGAA